MSDLPPFARALLQRREQHRRSHQGDEFDDGHLPAQRMPSPDPRHTSPGHRLFPPYRMSPPPRGISPQHGRVQPRRVDLDDLDESSIPRAPRRISTRRRSRRHLIEDETTTADTDFTRVITNLRQKNKLLKGRVHNLTKENHEMRKHIDDDPSSTVEVDRLRNMLKEEQVRSKLHQDRIRALENEVKTKDQIIETKDILIKRLQVSCQEQADEYTRVADQLKFQFTLSPRRDPIIDINPKLFKQTPRNIDLNNMPINNNFGGGVSDNFNNPQSQSKFNDAFGAPPLNDRFENYGAPTPGFADDMKGMPGPNGYAGPFGEDQPVGRPNPSPFGNDPFGANNFNDFGPSPEDIRKQIDVLLPHKQELERKMNLIPPKGKENEYQRNKEIYEQELNEINRKISRLKLTLRQMKSKPKV